MKIKIFAPNYTIETKPFQGHDDLGFTSRFPGEADHEMPVDNMPKALTTAITMASMLGRFVGADEIEIHNIYDYPDVGPKRIVIKKDGKQLILDSSADQTVMGVILRDWHPEPKEAQCSRVSGKG